VNTLRAGGCAAGGDALERGHHVNTVVFDKTGTLTRGRPQVTEAVLFNSHYTMQQVRLQPAGLSGSFVCSTCAWLDAVCLSVFITVLFWPFCWISGIRAGVLNMPCTIYRSLLRYCMLSHCLCVIEITQLLQWQRTAPGALASAKNLFKLWSSVHPAVVFLCAGVSACCCSGGV
jgi:hypothetical protein